MSACNLVAIKLPLFLLLVFTQIGAAQALDLDVRSDRSNRLDFSLQIEHLGVDLDNGISVVELNLNRIGIISIEAPPSGPQFGLLLGYAYADFSSNNVFESIEMDGYYLGVSVGVNLVKYSKFGLSLLGHYLYQSVEGKDDQARASLSWDEFAVTALFNYRMESTGEFYVGLNTAKLDGRYRYNGTTNISLGVANDNRAGAIVGFDYNINRLETVGINYQDGSSKGVSLRFRKLF